MDFFKSVFSDDPSASSPESEDSSFKTTESPNPQVPAITNAWAFGSTLLKTIATKSELVIENYKQEFEDLSVGSKKESAIVRQAASRDVKDLPARLESGAAVAQTGEAIDNISSSVSVIITHGKDSIFNANDEDSESELMGNNDYNSDNTSKSNAKPYSRVDALIRAVQCDMKTYSEEPEDAGEYEEWKKGFAFEEKSGEIEDIVKENSVIGEIYDEVVPEKVDHETFWTRYSFRLYRVRRAKEARVKLVKRAIEGEEEEELSWDVVHVDDDEKEEDTGFKSKEDPEKEVEEKVDNTMLHGDEGVEEFESEVKSDDVTEGKSNESGEKVGSVLDDKVGNCLRRLSKHPRKKIRCLASDVNEMCIGKLYNKTTREHKTVELHGPESSSVKPEELLKSEPYETDSSVSNKSEKSSFMKSGYFSTACSKLERPDRPNDMKGENSTTRESIENASVAIDDENRPEEKKQGDHDKNPTPVGGVVVPKLNSIPLTKDKVRDQVREILAEAMCKVSTEVKDDLQKQVSACDPYRIAAMLETITFEEWGRFDGPQEYKYRCLMLNLKDPSNPDFRRKILLGHLPAHSIVKLTREEMASEERQRQREIIKEKAVLKLPSYSDWSSCLRFCSCKAHVSVRLGNRFRSRGLNVGHRSWKRIGHRKKKPIARGSRK